MSIACTCRLQYCDDDDDDDYIQVQAATLHTLYSTTIVNSDSIDIDDTSQCMAYCTSTRRIRPIGRWTDGRTECCEDERKEG